MISTEAPAGAQRGPAEKLRREEQASVIMGLRRALAPDEQLLAFTRGRIAGGWRGRLSVGPEAFFSPQINVGLTERRLILQHYHSETGKVSEILPHSFLLEGVRNITFSDIETFGADPACRLVIDLPGEQKFRIRIAGAGNFETARNLEEVFRSLRQAREEPAPATLSCTSCGRALEQPTRFCPFCGAALANADSGQAAPVTTVTLKDGLWELPGGPVSSESSLSAESHPASAPEAGDAFENPLSALQTTPQAADAGEGWSATAPREQPDPYARDTSPPSAPAGGGEEPAGDAPRGWADTSSASPEAHAPPGAPSEAPAYHPSAAPQSPQVAPSPAGDSGHWSQRPSSIHPSDGAQQPWTDMPPSSDVNTLAEKTGTQSHGCMSPAPYDPPAPDAPIMDSQAEWPGGSPSLPTTAETAAGTQNISGESGAATLPASAPEAGASLPTSQEVEGLHHSPSTATDPTGSPNSQAQMESGPLRDWAEAEVQPPSPAAAPPEHDARAGYGGTSATGAHAAPVETPVPEMPQMPAPPPAAPAIPDSITYNFVQAGNWKPGEPIRASAPPPPAGHSEIAPSAPESAPASPPQTEEHN